jgi:hypothetical protein
MSELTELQLLKLYYCAESTRRGATDKGDPENLGKLQVLGYTEKAADGGYTVTTEGSAYLKLNKHKLFPPKKKEKKSKFKERKSYDNEDENVWDDVA